MESAQKSSEKAIEVAMDPFYAQFPKMTLGFAFLLGGQLQEAEDALQSLSSFSEKFGMGETLEIAHIFLAPTLIAKGHMKQGIRMLEKTRQELLKNNRRLFYALSESVLGKVYSQIATGPTPAFPIMAKNIGFLVKNIPFAGKKADEHLNKAIKLAI